MKYSLRFPLFSSFFMTTLLLLGAGFPNALFANSPTIEGMQERLEAEIKELDAERDERLQALRSQYRGALERRLGELGQGAASAPLREELERVSGDGRLAPAMPASQGELQRFHRILLDQIAVAEQPRTDRLNTLINNLQAFSNNQSSQLRRQGRQDEAERWKQWGDALPARYLTGVADNGKSRFMTLLEAGEKPYLIIIGTSTSEHTGGAVDAPWRQCAGGNRTEWPAVLSPALREIGEVRIGGSTCAGVTSREFMERGRLRPVLEEKPDAVIIEFAPGADSVDRFNMTVADSRAAHEEMIAALREANPDMEIFLWTGARSFNSGGGRGAHWDRRDGSGREASNEGQPEYAQMYRDLARDAGPGIRVIDTYATFENLFKRDERSYRTYFRDGNHTNRRGAEEIIVPEILRTLRGEN